MYDRIDTIGDERIEMVTGVDDKADANYSDDVGGDAGVDLNDGDYDSGIQINEPIENTGEDLNENDSEKLDSLLDSFQEGKWSDMSLQEQKQSMTNLADYVADMTGNNNPPTIVFCDEMNNGEYGGYNPSSNELEINENMIGDSTEAADTVAHEMWHAYQQQCALDPASEKGREYQEAFDDYICPEYDYEGYQNQRVEVEARMFAQGFKDRLREMKGEI